MTDRRTFLRPLPRRSIAADAVWALLAALVFSAPIELELEHASALAVAAATVAIALRRLSPSGALLMTVVLGFVQVAGGERPSLVDLAIAVVIGTAAVVGTRTEAVLAGVLALVAGAFGALYLATTGYRYAVLLQGPPDQVVIVLAAPALVLLSVWAIGLATRAVRSQNVESVRRADAEAAATRAEALADRAEAVATRAVDEAESERIRADIARDVHDVVGHSLAVIIAQADSVPFLDDEARIREVSATIASTARSSLVEVRQVLGHIDGSDQAAQPASFEEIVQGIREAGVTVDHAVRGTARPLGAVHGTAARRSCRRCSRTRCATENRAAPSRCGRPGAPRTSCSRSTTPCPPRDTPDRAVRARRPRARRRRSAGVRPTTRVRPGAHRHADPTHRDRRVLRRRRPGRRVRRTRPHPVRRPRGDRTMTDPIRILLTDDQALFRAGLRVVLDAQEDMVVVGEASDGAEALAAIPELRPDVMLLDMRMAGVDGVEDRPAALLRRRPRTAAPGDRAHHVRARPGGGDRDPARRERLPAQGHHAAVPLRRRAGRARGQLGDRAERPVPAFGVDVERAPARSRRRSRR